MCLIIRAVSRVLATNGIAIYLYETDMRSNSIDDGKEILLASDIDTDGEIGSFLCHEMQEGPRGGIVVFLSTIFVAA